MRKCIVFNFLSISLYCIAYLFYVLYLNHSVSKCSVSNIVFDILMSYLFNILNVVFWFNMQLNLGFCQVLYCCKETGTSLKKPIWFHLLNPFSLTYWPIKLNCYYLIFKRSLATYEYIYCPIDLLFQMKITFH